jgi:hypothetical protein
VAFSYGAEFFQAISETTYAAYAILHFSGSFDILHLLIEAGLISINIISTAQYAGVAQW